MASPPFEVEDQVEEEFFDKLVDDDDNTDLSRSGLENKESDKAKESSNLCTDEGVEDSEGNVGSKRNGKKGDDDDFEAGEKDSSSVGDVTHEGVMEVVGELDCDVGKNDVRSGTGVKLVDWSAFKSDSTLRRGAGKGSYSDFFNELGDSSGDLYGNVADNSGVGANHAASISEGGVSSIQHHEGQLHGSGLEQTSDVQDMNSSQYWENLYPGWRYDPTTGQWYPVEGYNNTVVGSYSDWNQDSQGNVEYPSHMVFDPQYPGWYYDTIAQEWQSLESYTAAMSQSTFVDHNQHLQNGVDSTDAHTVGNNQVMGWAGTQDDKHHQNTKSEGANFVDNPQLRQPYDSTHQEYKSSGNTTSFEQAKQNFDISNGVAGFQSFSQAESFSQHLNQHKREQSQQLHFSSAYFDSPKKLAFSQQLPQSASQFSSVSDEDRSSAGRPPHALVTFGFGGKLIFMNNNSSFLTNSAYSGQDSVGGVINIFNLMDLVMAKADALSNELGARGYFYTLCQQSFPGPLVGVNVGSRELNKWIDEKIAKCERSDMDYRKGELLSLLYSLLKIACQYYGKLRSPFGSDKALKDSDSPESAVAKLFASAKRSVSKYGAIHHCLQNFPSEAQIQATALEVQKLLVSGRIKEALQCAQEGQLWGPALVLATQLGDQFYADTVKKMAVCQLVDGSPLRTLCLLIAGQPADVFSSTTNVGSPKGAEKISQQPGQLGAHSMLHDWEENLAIITANRTKDDELVIIHLGDCLWKDKGEVLAAHICYLVAEANFATYSDTARLCLIGADHWRFPRTYASPEAIQSTELYEYSKVLGNPQFLLLPFLPYKFVYALMLAEVGKVSDSLKYCQAILKCLKTGRASEVDTWKHKVASLEERLRIHQQGGYSVNLAPGKLVGKLLNLFDSTAHLVVGGLPPPAPSISKQNNSQNEHDRQKPGPRVSNSQSTMAMSSLVPSSSVEPMSEWTGGTNRMKISNRCASEPDFGKSPRKADASPKVSSPDMQEKPSASGGSSRFGRFGSSLFQKTVGFVLRSRADRQAKLGEKNKFYYDEKLKRWVEEGAEPPAEEAALAPPPTTPALQNRIPSINVKDGPKTENLQSNDGSSENKSPSSSESSSSSGIPPIPPSSNQLAGRRRMGVRSSIDNGEKLDGQVFGQNPVLDLATCCADLATWFGLWGSVEYVLPSSSRGTQKSDLVDVAFVHWYVDTFNKGGGSQTNLFQSPSTISSKSGGGANTKFFVPSPPSSLDDTMPASGENTPASLISNEVHSPCSKNSPFPSSPTAKLVPTMQRIPSMDNITTRRMRSRSIALSSVSPHSRRTLSWSGGSLSEPSNLSKVAEPKPLGEALGLPPSLFVPGDTDTSTRTGTRDDLHEVELR
ncbi:hypothetical protein LguiA_019251 [Lonicera macranthoides]